MSEGEINRIIGALQAWQQQQTAQIDTLFSKVDAIKGDTASLRTDFALQKQDIKELKENGCARGESHDKAIERIKQEMMDGIASDSDNSSEVTLLGGKLLSVKNVKFTGRDVILLLVIAGLILVWLDKLHLLDIVK